MMTPHQKANQSIGLMHHRKLARGKVEVSSIVNRGSVGGRIKKDENFLLHVLVHADSERIMYVALLGGNINCDFA